MALMQIAEPGQSSLPHQVKRAIGIDLGTTNSLVATVRGGRAQTLPDEHGQTMLQSAVSYVDEQNVVSGEAALALAAIHPSDTLVSFKRFMGRGAEDAAAEAARAHYRLDPTDGGMVRFLTAAGPISPVQASAEILNVLHKRAEETLGGAIDGAVVTVPAYFDDAQRQATKDAAALAGLNVLRLLNEPTAAAVAYGLDSGDEGVIAVYDLGGGTFDISILRLQRGVFEVLATGGDTALGGDDFDQVLAEWIAQTAGLVVGLSDQDQSSGDVANGEGIAGQYRALKLLARSAKERLSNEAEVTVDLAAIDPDKPPLTVSRRTFEELTAPLVKRTLRACRRCLRDADIEQVDNIVMVGGSTRVPLVRREVAEFFAREPLVDIDPDRVVAIGAAIQADTLVGNRQGDEVLLLDVIPLSLGLETMGAMVEKIIPRNTTIPVTRAQDFTTYKDGQTALAIHVVQGEREMVDDCRSLARFELRGIPPMVAGAARIRVTFQVDADGLLSVAAREETTGVEAGVTVKPSFGLSDEDISHMLQSSFDYASQDKKSRHLAEQILAAEQLLENLAAALQVDGDALLSPAERDSLQASMSTLKALLEGQDAAAVTAATESLGQQSEIFATRRMDKSINQALAGVNLSDLEDEVPE